MKNFAFYFSIYFITLSYSFASSQNTHIDSVTSAKTWSIKNKGVLFSLTQILPQQLQAFYVNRGFSLKQIEDYTSSCVYMTVLRNDSAPGKIHFISNNWSIIVDKKPKPLVPITQWINRLKAKSAKKSALIAFRWAQFPPEQEYEPGGDWNQGMLSIGLPANKKFDIVAHWDIAGKQFETTLKGVQCAK